MIVFEIRVLLLLLSSVQCLCDCPLPPSGSTSCSDSKPPDNIPNIQGAAPRDGSCEFDSSFCNYSQGCRDPDASDWTSFALFAKVQGRNNTASHSSVVQSPLLRIDHVTCFKFSGAVQNPSRLSVYFGVELNNSCTVISQIASGTADTFDKAVNIRPATGKIFFRATSGGHANGYVRLYSVSLTTGRCEDPRCSFEAAYNDRACDAWEWNGWSMKWVTIQAAGLSGNVAALKPGLPAGTLKTDLAMATGTQTVCLQFLYRLNGINDTLVVSVQHEDGVTELLWEVMNQDEYSSWSYATAPLRSDNAFFILFQGQRCHTRESKDIVIDDVQVVRPSSCSYFPQGSKPSSQQLTGTLDPSCDLLPRTTTPVTTTSADIHMPGTTTSVQEHEASGAASPASDLSTPTPHDSSLNGSTEEYDPVPVTVGAVVGVVVLVVVCVVIAVVIWRIRKRNRSGSENNELSLSSGVGDGAMNNMEPLLETAAAPDIPSATETHYDGLGELSPQSHYTSLVGTESASEAAAYYYNIDSSTQRGRHGPLSTPSAETPYESLGEQSPPSVYTSLQNTAAASNTGTYYSNDFAQDNRSHYNVTPGNSAYYNVVKDPQDVKTQNETPGH